MYHVDPKSDVWLSAVKGCGQLRRTGRCGDNLRLWDRPRVDIKQDEVTSIFELESSLLPVLLEMKTKGVRVDIDRAEQIQIGLGTDTREGNPR